jgi:hypothetical protein
MSRRQRDVLITALFVVIALISLTHLFGVTP